MYHISISHNSYRQTRTQLKTHARQSHMHGLVHKSTVKRPRFLTSMPEQLTDIRRLLFVQMDSLIPDDQLRRWPRHRSWHWRIRLYDSHSFAYVRSSPLFCHFQLLVHVFLGEDGDVGLGLHPTKRSTAGTNQRSTTGTPGSCSFSDPARTYCSFPVDNNFIATVNIYPRPLRWL